MDTASGWLTTAVWYSLARLRNGSWICLFESRPGQQFRRGGNSSMLFCPLAFYFHFVLHLCYSNSQISICNFSFRNALMVFEISIYETGTKTKTRTRCWVAYYSKLQNPCGWDWRSGSASKTPGTDRREVRRGPKEKSARFEGPHRALGGWAWLVGPSSSPTQSILVP